MVSTCAHGSTLPPIPFHEGAHALLSEPVGTVDNLAPARARDSLVQVPRQCVLVRGRGVGSEHKLVLTD